MAKVARIGYSKNLNSGKLKQLREIASRLGNPRQEVWHRYGSIAGVGLTHRQIRNDWLAEGRKFDLPARLWKETLRDTFDNICLYLESAKAKVRKAIPKRTTSVLERKRLFTLLKEERNSMLTLSCIPKSGCEATTAASSFEASSERTSTWLDIRRI